MKNYFSEITNLFLEGINVVKPSVLIEKNVWLSGDILNIKRLDNLIEKIDLSQYKNIYLIGAGKASAAMAKQMEKIIGNRITKGIIVTKYGFGTKLNNIELLESNHPLPEKNGLIASQKIVDLCKLATNSDLVINLLSGGASALLPLPVLGITLDEKVEVTNNLLKSGATINEVNVVRRHLSQLKGGGLLKFIYPAKVVSLILSDVIGDKLNIIGSGITVPTRKSYSECWAIIEKYNLKKIFPKPVIAYLEKELERETNGKFNNHQYENSAINIIIGNNYKALSKIKTSAIENGYKTKIINAALEGEAKAVGKQIADDAILFAKEKAEKNKKYCFLYGGETTVNIKGKGKGGRNQELVLSASIALDGKKSITILSGGTDGNDGPTNAAGAICDGKTVELGKTAGLNVLEYLDNNDSYNYFKNIDSLLITGPTGTNVIDIQIVLIEIRN